MKTSTLIALSRRLDKTLTHFALGGQILKGLGKAAAVPALVGAGIGAAKNAVSSDPNASVVKGALKGAAAGGALGVAVPAVAAGVVGGNMGRKIGGRAASNAGFRQRMNNPAYMDKFTRRLAGKAHLKITGKPMPKVEELSAQIDSYLHEFKLAPAANGEYPWQTAQREKRQRRVVGGALVGGAAIGAGAYGAKKLNARYGTQGMDGMKAGAADLINRADDKLKPMLGKAKAMAGQGMDKLKGAAAPVMDVAKRKIAAGKVSYGRGVAQKQGAGKLIARVGRALIHAARADVLVELEAKLDGALQEFGAVSAGAAIGGLASATKKKEGETTPEYLQRTAKGAAKGAVIGAGVSAAGSVAGALLLRKRSQLRMAAANRRASMAKAPMRRSVMPKM